MGAGHIVECQVITKSGEVESARDLWVAEQRLQLRAKIQIGASPMHVQRLDSEAVATEYQAFGGLTPEAQGEHPAKAREAVHIPLKERLESDFGIATCCERMA